MTKRKNDQETTRDGNIRQLSRKTNRPADNLLMEAEADISRHGGSATTSPQNSPIGASFVERLGSESEEHAGHNDLMEKSNEVEGTPSAPSIPRRRRGRPKKITGDDSRIVTPQKGPRSRNLVETPIKFSGIGEENQTPRLQRNADRSARKKSTRKLIERTILGTTSDNDEEEEEDIAQEIFGSEDEEDGLELRDALDIVSETPTKRKGRPKGSKKIMRSPSPLNQTLQPHEIYFSQNRGGRAKTSDNNLSALKLLDHEEYFSISRKMTERHADNIESLQAVYEDMFDQWQFELEQGFSICTYGWGSKKDLLMSFADHIYKSKPDHTRTKIVIVNGYVATLTIRDVFNTLAVAVSKTGYKLGSQPGEMLENLFALLEEDGLQEVTLIIHSIDRIPLRRPATQTLLSRLSSHPQIHLIASADHPSFPLLWDSSLRSTYNFLFHDCTTFKDFSVETDVVDEVHELLGRSGRRIGGKEGVIFVLRSLPENARSLYRVMIGEQLASMDENPKDMFEEYEEDEFNEQRMGPMKRGEGAIEYRALYQKAVQEFICSNDMNFRTLLKEFHDHQMVQSKKDAMGVEMLSIPFRKEELENILDDLAA